MYNTQYKNLHGVSGESLGILLHGSPFAETLQANLYGSGPSDSRSASSELGHVQLPL